MEFARLKKDLTRLADTERLSEEIIIGLLFDICEDVRAETGTTADRHETKDISALLKVLPRVGRILLNTMNHNLASITDVSRAEKMTALQQKLLAQTQELEAAEQRNEQLQSKAAALQQQEAALREQHRIQLEKNEQCEQLQKKITQIQSSTAEYSALVLPQKQTELHELEQEQMALRELADALTADCAQAQAGIQDLQNSIRHFTEKKQTQEQQRLHLQDAVAAVTEEVQQVEIQVSQISTELGTLEHRKKELQELLENNDSEGMRVQLLQTIEQLQAACKAAADLQDELNRKQKEIDRLQAEYREKDVLKSELTAKKITLQKQCAGVREWLRHENPYDCAEAFSQTVFQVSQWENAAAALETDLSFVQEQSCDVSYFAMKLVQLRTELRDYQKTYHDFIEQLGENGGEYK